MYTRELECLNCGKSFPIDPSIYTCKHCGGILEVEYDYDELRRANLKKIFRRAAGGVWKYRELMPIDNYSHIVSLSNSETELLKCERLGRELGVRNLLIKNETRNPSGSFKDRPMTVAVSKAKEFGLESVVTASSGNAGASLAAHAARGGMSCFVFVPSKAPIGKVSQIIAHGVTVILVKGAYSNSYRLAKLAAQKYGWFNVTSTFLNPYATEGNKTSAYEIYEQLGLRTPDWVVIPVGTGPLLVGCWRGFAELESFNLTAKVPAMVGAQAEGCAPIVRAFKSGNERVRPWEALRTIASGIADPLQGYSQDGTLTLKTIERSRGFAEACSDEDIIAALKLLAQKEGVFAEPSGATSVAVLRKLVQDGKIDRNDVIVCAVTGSGLKDVDTAKKTCNLPPEIKPNFRELRRLLVTLVTP